MITWQFDTEFSLEEFIWVSLEPLLSLQPLARQYSTEGQICDILAITPERQLVVLELKNVEDRYVVPQLTRYYASLRKEQPFADQVDYSLPIRLIAIAPTYHAHNYVDREHSRLDFEFWTFEVDGLKAPETFRLKSLDSENICFINIPMIFHSSLQQMGDAEVFTDPVRVIGRPPRSLRGLLEKLDVEKQEYLLALRRKILEFDERMAEVGLSVRTQYGLKKANKGIPNNRVCAEILKSQVWPHPVLHLMLPYPKGGLQRFKKLSEQSWAKGLGLAQVPLFQEDWEKRGMVGFFLGKSRQSPSHGYVFKAELYSQIYSQLVGTSIELATTEDLINLALQEWQANLSV
jgi:RecB family endonuclease NucS